MVELLLNSNADPTIESSDGATAYSIARDSNRPVNAHIILEGLVVRGIYNDDAGLIMDSIRSGAYVNVRTGGGWNALIWASATGHAEAVTELLALGANVNHVENEGWSPLHFAALNGHYEIVRALLNENDIDAGIVNNDGQSARDLGAAHADIVEALDAHVAAHAREL
jgi:ankyrin repeat protein